MITFCSSLSFSRNSIYSIHYSYYSISCGSLITSFVLLFFISFTSFILFYFILYFLLFVCMFDFLFVYLIYMFVYMFLCLLYLFVCLFVFMFVLLFLCLLFMWILDFGIENSFGFTRQEQLSLVYGIKLFIFSEFMLFVACFWGIINARFICFFVYSFSCFISFSFSISYSNLIILLFSSLPIQSALIFYKVGLFIGIIEELGQTISCGIVFLVLQIKEFFYSYLSISDCIIGSIFYFTTGLHGMHVIFGLLFFFVIFVLFICMFICLFIFLFYFICLFVYLLSWLFYSLYYFLFIYLFICYFICLFVYLYVCLYICYFIFYIIFYSCYNEYSLSYLISSYYWHFVDIIWFLVFLVYFVC